MSPLEDPAGVDPTARPIPSARSTWRRWLHSRALRWVWAVLVLLVVTVVVAREWPRVAGQVGDLSWPLVTAAVVVTALAKLLLGENARLAAARHAIVLSRATATRLYNLSQLGKYVPGSVWQFVGRAVAYRDRGARGGDIRDALLTESLWLVGGAGVVGLLLGGAAVLPVVAGGLSGGTALWLVIIAVAALLMLVCSMVWRRRAATAYARAAVPSARVVVVQSLVWLLLGTGFWCLCRAADVGVGWAYAVGLFSAAYAVGFVVLFAPAGLGVRDAILVAGLSPVTGVETGILVAVVARLVYVGVELLAVGLGELAWWRLARRAQVVRR